MRGLVRGILFFISLFATLLCCLAVSFIFFSFISWLALSSWNIFLPDLSINSVDPLALLLGAAGTIYIFLVDDSVQRQVGGALRRVIGFINWLLPQHKKEA